MRIRSFIAALLLVLAMAACQTTPGGGTESMAPSMSPHSDMAAPSATPYAAPGY